MPLIEIKDFNAVIDIKPFSDQLVKSKQEGYEKRVEMSRENYNRKLIKLVILPKLL